jgi:hypothetical protein
MKSIIRTPMALAAGLVAIGLLGTSARADLILTVMEDGGSTQTFSLAGSPTSDLALSEATVTTTDYTIKVLGGEANQFSIGPGINEAQLLSAVTSITKKGTSMNALHITITGTGYTAPNTPPPIGVDSQIGGSVATTSAGNTLNFQSIVNGSGMGAQTPGITTTGAYNNDNPGTIGSLTGTFSIEQTIDILLKGDGDTVNYSSTTSLTGVPEPSSLALAGLGALGMVGFCWLRSKARGA